MEPATKRGDEDRISQLPDPILHHILSYNFLKIKHVVRTCVLSRRWRNVWASMPNLCFSNDDWDCDEEDGEEVNIDFPTFMNTVLLRREPLDVDRFNIMWEDFSERETHHITNWVHYAVNHNVKFLFISLSTSSDLDDYEFPSRVFTCPTVEDLYLSIDGPRVYFTAVACLRLITLFLVGFTSRTIIPFNTLVYGCPVLESLRLEYCELEDADISSKSLKHLIIVDCELRVTRIRISVPSLELLQLSGNHIEIEEDVLLDNLSSLIEATLQAEQYDKSDGQGSGHKLLKFVSPRAEGVTRQTLSEHQSFYKLVELKLTGWRMLENFPAVAHFLQHSPNLKLLTLESSEQHSTLKKWFTCSHREICITSQCGVENDRILKSMTDFFSSKCDCFQD